MDSLDSASTATGFSTTLIVQERGNRLPTIADMIAKRWDRHDMANALEIVHTEITDFIRSSPGMPPHVLDIELKWRQFAVGLIWQTLPALPAGMLQVLLLDIWKDFCTVKHGPHGWTMLYTLERYRAQTGRPTALGHSLIGTGGYLSAISATQGRNSGGGMVDPSANSLGHYFNYEEMNVAQDVGTAPLAESSGEEFNNLGTSSASPIETFDGGVHDRDL